MMELQKTMINSVKVCQHCKQKVPVRENGTAVKHFVFKSVRGKKVKHLCQGSERLV